MTLEEQTRLFNSLPTHSLEALERVDDLYRQRLYHAISTNDKTGIPYYSTCRQIVAIAIRKHVRG